MASDNISIEEYLEQDPVKKQPYFSVRVPRWACFQIHNGHELWIGNKRIRTEIIWLKIFGQFITYLSINNNLWTMDEDGNPQSPSVFKLSDI